MGRFGAADCGRLSLALLALCGVGLLSAPGCNSEEAILLLVRPPSGVQLSQYEVKIQDRDSRTLIYQSGIQPVAAVASGRDLSIEPLRLGLKLSKSGKFLVFVRAAVGNLVPDGSKPQQRASEYFFATVIQTAGTTEVNGTLLEVAPDFDRDQDHFPDAVTWPLAVLAAKVQYQSQLEVLDCVDQDPAPSAPQLPAGLYAQQINPLATPRCGLSIDVACATAAPTCKDADGDGEPESTDCDDSDPKRFHKNPRPRNCCTCTDHNSCATDHSKRSDQASCQPPRCDNSFDFDCTGQVVPCFVDDDCDGYSPNDPVPSQRDCDDTNPDVHPGAVKKCADPTHDWACDGNPRGGCITCDLDNDGYQRKDAAANCPDSTDIHPGQIDCDDNDRGVFPGSTSYAGATLIISDLKKNEGGGSVAAALRRLCANKAVDGKTAQDADCDGSPQLGCPPAMVGGKVCDADGDGFPNANPGCNPNNLPLDCLNGSGDNDPHTFPGAPDKCGDGLAQNCSSDTACSMDADHDGYNSDVDCNDSDPAIHPFATEVCDGVDNDCDGLIDELNPDSTGARLVETHGTTTTIMSCTDYDTGDCGLPSAGGTYSGRCVCSGLVPGKHAADTGRHACPGTVDTSVTAPKCFGATQPGQQTCIASQLHDEDCDGRTDAVDGKNLKEYGDVCGVTTGECVGGKVVACDRSKINKFAKPPYGSFTVMPAFSDERRFLVCDATAAYPSVELCDLKDNDCNSVVDDCSGPGLLAPKCCGGVNMCLDLNSDFMYCGSCTGACNTATANACVSAKCMCGSNPACSGALGYCKGGSTCVQCLADANCSGATPRCNAANVCVQCTSNADCSGATPACNTVTNTCVPCVLNADCKDPANPACDTATHSCVACTVNNDCPATTPSCKVAVHQCVQCTVSGDCPGGMQCDVPNNACVQCIDNFGCAAMATNKVCKTALQTCVQCLIDSDCGAGMQCETGTNTCVQCVDNTGCATMATNKVCKAAQHQCVQCLADTDCGAGMQCNTMNNTCVQCVDNTGCATMMTNKVCKAAQHQCVQCLVDTDCAAGMQCNPGTNTCVQCVDNTGCATMMTNKVCKVAQHQCVQCLADGDCGAGKQCNTTTNTCVQCVDDTGCAGATPYCKTGTHTCVACNTDPQCSLLDPTYPKCDPTANVCYQCLGDTDCAARMGIPSCDTTSHLCVQCQKMSDCALVPGKTYCKAAAEKCVECIDDTPCMGTAKPYCDTGAGSCVECNSNTDCALLGLTTCDPMAHTCS